MGVRGSPRRDAWVNREPVRHRCLVSMIVWEVETDERATDETNFVSVRLSDVLGVVANGSTYRRARLSISYIQGGQLILKP